MACAFCAMFPIQRLWLSAQAQVTIKLKSDGFASVTLWPDADEPGMKAAQRTAQKWANQSYQVQNQKVAARP